MVKLPWQGADTPKPGPSNVTDDDIARRVRKAEERAKKAGRISREHNTRSGSALDAVRDNG
jgi:hypothetical protein